jgi:hypothetical protein
MGLRLPDFVTSPDRAAVTDRKTKFGPVGVLNVPNRFEPKRKEGRV